jgi:tetratricopeptide (TPR) repeat protein
VAGNQRAYDTAMKRAASLAWDKKWSRAIEEYRKALDEFPKDVTALTGLGLAYTETRQLQKALEVYRHAANLSPDNPEVIQRVGYMLERLAQWPDAANAYILSGDACLRLRDITQAIELWQKAAILDPENMRARQNLVRAYRAQGKIRLAARQHLIMARVQARRGRAEEAIEHCRAALELDRRNVEAQDILEALRRGLPLPDGPTARLQLTENGKRTLDSFVVFEDIEAGSSVLIGEAQRVSPADLVRQRSLGQMAEALFSEVSDPKKLGANRLLAQGADFESRGLTSKAISTYMSAIEAGADTLAVHFNLGLLYREIRDFARSLDHLNRTLPDPEYALGAHFAIGECYNAWGKTTEALRHLLEALRIVDAQIVDEGSVAELNAAYGQFSQKYARQDGEVTQRLVQSLSSLFSNKEWRQQVVRIRQHLDSLAGGGVLATLAEAFAEPEADVAMTAISQIQEYVEQSMLFTALEECFWAIQKAPYYLPLHLRAADILVKEGRLEEAVHKYITVAETYKARGEMQRAILIYRKALEIAPMDVQVREQLIHMLIGAGFVDQALEQYMTIADAYYQLAQVNRAIEKYTEALKYATQGDPARHWEVNVLHRIGDIYMQRVNWRQAMRAYQRIKRIDEQDEKARLSLVDLYFKTEQRDEALRELDELIEFYGSRRQPRQVLSLLQDAVRSRPDELALHMRLAKLYIDTQMKEEAIAELDTVGEMQLNAGMTREAIRTIQAIIRLGPGNVHGYQQLLAQLKG